MNTQQPNLRIKNPEEFRSNIRERIGKLIYKEEKQKQEQDQEKIPINIEKACFNYAIQEAGKKKIIKKWENPLFTQLYMDHLRTLYYNLEESPHIQVQLKTGEITPQQFVFMSHQEINPELWKTHIENKIRKDKNKFNQTIQASTNLFKCKKCGERNCSYYELQTRSSDESTTIFVSCLSCGANFKIC